MSATTSNSAPLPEKTAQPAKPLLDHGADDGMTTDRNSANKQPAEEQLRRFLHWLQFTDRGHQPC